MHSAPIPEAWSRLQPMRGAILDMDGVLYRGETAIPGAIQALEVLRRHLAIAFLTNNSTKRREPLVEHLRSLGFTIHASEIILVADVLERHLLTHHAGAPILLLGEDHLHERLRQAGLVLIEATQWRQAAVVVCACRLSMSHDLLGAALNALRQGATFVLTNPDLTVDGADGQRLEAGAYGRMLALATGRQPVVLGKPETPAYDLALGQLGLPAAAVMMIGDNPDTDLDGARRHGLLSIQVLSGISQAPSSQADLVFTNLGLVAKAVASSHHV